MKIKIKYLLASLLAAGMAFASCGQEEPVGQEVELTVSPASMTLDPQGGQDFISVTSGDAWLVRSDVNWIKFEPASGKASLDPVKVTVTFEANTSGQEREAVVTVKTLKGISREVKASQAKLEGPLAKRGISTAEDLMNFARAVNEGTPLSNYMVDGSVVLLNDIDASSIKEWTPAGTPENPFTGTFNGKGKCIKNINWTVDASAYPNTGIIGYSKGATVVDLTVGVQGDKVTVNSGSGALNMAAVVGYAEGGSISNCTNNADVVYTGSASGENVCIAGICGRYMADKGKGVTKCSNKGDVLSPVICRAAGFVAYNEGPVTGCVNEGCILAEKSGEIGPAWGCSYNKNYGDFADNIGRGHVDSYNAFKDNPSAADSDAYLNAVVSPAREGYDMEKVQIDMSKESYYDWTEVSSKVLSPGVKYIHYDGDNVPRKFHVLEIDLSNPAVELTTSYANDCVPNPNGNKNSNNGFNLRETLSQLCERKRSEGQNIIAGINTGFFDSNDGISRGFHVEEGEPLYINHPGVVSGLPNHSWGLTVFADGTASCGKKNFTGKVKLAGSEYRWYTKNDTTLRHTTVQTRINLYDSRYKKQPHASRKDLVNKLAPDALYVIAEYVDGPMIVNGGYASAKVVKVADGRSAPLDEAPYITAENQIGLSLSGNEADIFFTNATVGSTIELRCDITIEGEEFKPIYTQNSTMFHILKDGKDNIASIPSTHTVLTKQDPLTFPVVSQDKKTVWLVEIDGRQGWYSTGVIAYEMMRIAQKLGGYNMTRFDGGGSSAMWVYDSASGKGKIVNSVSDSKGERSCLNYILIKAK